MFPTVTANRQLLHAHLRRFGIDSHVWWRYLHPSVPWEAFPAARSLKEGVLGFPIHQDLEILHMEKIVEALGKIQNTTSLLDKLG